MSGTQKTQSTVASAHDPADRFIDTDTFVEWCERQAEQSRSRTARIIVSNDDQTKFRIREETEYVEDIVLVEGDSADVLRFERREDGEIADSRHFAMHRRKVTFHDKTLIVRDGRGDTEGVEICRAGTGTKNQKGPFPV